MKKCFFLVLVVISAFSCSDKKTVVSYQSGSFLIGINSEGLINQLIDLKSNKNYISKDTIAPILSCRIDSQIHYPVSANVENNRLVFSFKGDLQAIVKVNEKDSHVTFELVEFKHPENVELIVWGPIPTTIKKVIGETVGVVRGEEYALGIQALNPKTLGGYPWTDNDCTPQFDIFEQEDYSDLSEENKRHTLYRVEAAKPEKFGSTLQAYCRNRNKERIIKNLNHDRFVSPVYNDGGFIGSKIALFGCPVGQSLETIGKIERAEGLPHPTIDGKWGKQVRSASAAYLIYGFNENNIDEAIAFTRQAGLRYLYHPGPFKNWGHFELKENEFPNGWDGMKACIEKAEKEGVYVGLHTLSNFTTTNDPYVTPVPDPRLGKVGSSVLTGDIDAEQTEIPIESPDFFNQFKNNHLHGVMIGEELVRYGTVSDKAPWKLLDCERGAWDTKAGAHKKGTEAAKLIDHGYKVFLTNPELSIEQAKTLAEMYNYCGLRQISFDGLEGNRSTGMGNYGEILFTTTWYNKLTDEIKSHLITDASRTTHYFWHIYSRMNWGEPWYAGFRESQTEYRLKNQAYFSRNMMPAMLGWFSMRNNTPVEDIEWMLARSAAFNAGYAFVTGERQLKTNGQSDIILQLIGEWEKARMANAFTDEQKELMKYINNEFTLTTLDENKWSLQQIHSYKFKHEAKVRQPGEPLFSTFEFENPEGETTMHFILTPQDADISAVKIEIDNSREIQLPITLKSGEILSYKGGASAKIMDEYLHVVKEIKLKQEQFKVAKGAHSVIFDCTFSNKSKEPLAKFEVRIPGKAEEIGE